MTFKPCLVVPHYNHHELIAGVIEKLEPLQLPLILVDDGSDEQYFDAVKDLIANMEWIHLLHHPQNRGKGAAVSSGLRHARLRQYTHAIQVDADGQHNIDDIPRLIECAEKYPQAIISGLPQFDDDIPRSRYYGRMLTHSLIMLETISLRVRDAMCGFRVYPLAQMERLFDRYYLGPRMDFDVEVLVKADWAGINIHYVPTKVSYPESGVSHFDYIRDNVDITRMHIRLLCGMLPRLPLLIWRQIAKIIY
ncbi:MAG: glycosyltransferase family 2 protein [Gammaproteobacteria bacterium]|nr:glycosyltransferase family 2 protein [Gammaproteobacteria bacterium]